MALVAGISAFCDRERDQIEKGELVKPACAKRWWIETSNPSEWGVDNLSSINRSGDNVKNMGANRT